MNYPIYILLYTDKITHSTNTPYNSIKISTNTTISGAMDAANLLKPALARGEFRCMGATTLDEYRENIEKDKALTRRFQEVQVQESTVEDTVSILRGLKETYENFHGVQIQDASLVASARLAKRYITQRNLPDSAIDLLDEACSGLRGVLIHSFLQY